LNSQTPGPNSGGKTNSKQEDFQNTGTLLIFADWPPFFVFDI